ncbi:MAG: DUF423 domain-containing protein [Spirulinaceae cyanobacterium RM2_2_10]|nr:DUF423 domain-containing protein [Spirulinaceae cyanobacterium RM2_2_10]
MGAFATHSLRDRLSERALEIFETGSRYQMDHALALLLLALLLSRTETGQVWLKAAGLAFLAGVVLFSGSLYALALSQVSILGAIAPLGGVAFLVGWGCVLVAALSGKF